MGTSNESKDPNTPEIFNNNFNLPQNKLKPKYCETAPCNSIADSLLNTINPAINPCDNFYNFACGNVHMKLNPVKTFDQKLRIKTNNMIQNILIRRNFVDKFMKIEDSGIQKKEKSFIKRQHFQMLQFQDQ